MAASGAPLPTRRRRALRLAGLGLVLAGALLGGAAGADPPPGRIAPPGPFGGPPSLEADVASLAHSGPRGAEAAERLLRRGEASLEPLHRALRDPDRPVAQRAAVVQLLGELGDRRSVAVLVEAARAAHRPGLTREVLRALGSMPADPAGFAFLESVLADPRASARDRGQALVALALQRESRAAPWGERLRGAAEAELRAAALFLCAALGDASALEPITSMIGERPEADFRYSLLLALAELTDGEDFEARAAPARRFTLEYDSARRIARFRSGDAAARAALFRPMLMSRFPHERRLAVRDLLARGELSTLDPFLARWPQLALPVRSTIAAELHRAGYRIAQRDRRLVIVGRSG